MKAALVIAMFAVTAAASVACGNPAGPAGEKTFVFTPAPYTVIAGPGGTPVPIAVNDERPDLVYQADFVFADVELDESREFANRVSNSGFDVIESFRYTGDSGPHYVSFRVYVPAGAAPAAVAFLREQPGVINAGYNYLYPLNDHDSPGG